MDADPYGLLASGLPPDLAAQLMGLQGRQAIANAMMQQSMEPMQQPVNKGDLQAKLSPIAAIAHALQMPMAQYSANKINQQYGDIATQATQRRAAALTNYETQRDGMPATQPLTPNDDQGNPMPSVGGTQGDPRAAIMQAMLDPMLRNNPVVSADLKKMEPNWKVEEIFDANGQKQKIRINMNDPTQVTTLGGAERKIAQVTTAGPDGRPVTRFVVQDPNAAPIAQPVKKEMTDTGKVIVPVDPYAPDPLAKTTSPNADQATSTAVRGQNMHRDTSLAVAGLDANGDPTGDIKQLAAAIASGQMPPLSAMALSRPRGQQIMSEVYNINPNYDVKDFHAADKAVNAFGSGKLGTQTRFFNVADNHLQTLGTLADALNNGDMRAFNTAGQAIAAQTGSAAPTNFDAAKQVVGQEIVKAISGASGALGDRQKVDEALSRVSSPAQLRGVVNTYRELIKGQLTGLRQQYEQSTGRKDFDRFLSPGVQAIENGGRNPVLDQADAILKGQ